MSVTDEESAEETRFGRIRVPRFSRMEVGNSSRTSLAKAERRVDGEREVVTRGLGSIMPERWAYSSSISSWASAVSSNL